MVGGTKAHGYLTVQALRAEADARPEGDCPPDFGCDCHPAHGPEGLLITAVMRRSILLS
jgi:hypothetical protein